MFDLTLVSSSSEKLLSISGEKVGRLVGWGEEDFSEENHPGKGGDRPSEACRDTPVS